MEADPNKYLRCGGQPGPKYGFHFESKWQNVATFAGLVLQIALDHNCNLFVVDPVANQVVEYNAGGQQVAAVNMFARARRRCGGGRCRCRGRDDVCR